MKAAECGHEFEVLEAVCSGHWTATGSQPLRDHASTCPACSEAVRLATAFQDDRAAAVSAARVPSAGLVWWRAEMRARRDAVARATRPLRIVELLAAACEVVAAILLLRRIGLPALADLLWQPSSTFFLALGAVAILAPLALYFVFSDD